MDVTLKNYNVNKDTARTEKDGQQNWKLFFQVEETHFLVQIPRKKKNFIIFFVFIFVFE